MRRVPIVGHAHRLMRYFAGSWPLYLPCLVLATLVRPLTSFVTGHLMGGAMESAMGMAMRPVYERLPLFVGGLLLGALIQIGVKYGRDIALEKTQNALRSDMLSHVARLPMPTLYKMHSGNLLAQFSMDAGSGVQACDQLFFMVCTLCVSNLVSIGYIFACSGLLGVVTIGVAVMSLLFNGFAAPYIKKLNDSKRARMAELSERLSDMLDGHTALRTDNREEYFSGRATRAVEDVFESSWKIKKVSMWTSAPAELSKFLIDGILMAAAILLFTDGKLDPDQVMTCWTLGTGIGFTMRGVAQQYTRMQEAMASADRVAALLGMEEESEGEETTALASDPAVSVRGVDFSYREGAPLFDRLNIDFQAGRSHALVGASGGGKTTLALMLLRFYDPQGGVVEVFGRDARDYTLKALRSLTAYVPQNPHLFDGTLWENIHYGDMAADEDEVLQAAKLAQVDAFVKDLPMGYQTRVGEMGTQLSGGQRQRVAIARALLKKAPILLLDEATASLDNRFEQDIQRALASLPKGQTILTIVHRLSTATGNDAIHVLEGGEVLESGDHEGLLAKDGRYAQLWRANQSLRT